MSSCHVCNAPGGLRPFTIDGMFGGREVRAHDACWAAWTTGNQEALESARKAACDAGHHRFPGLWSKDPADPYGDAAFWDCSWGCGYRHTHPGYGIGRGIAEARAAHPEAFADLEINA